MRFLMSELPLKVSGDCTLERFRTSEVSHNVCHRVGKDFQFQNIDEMKFTTQHDLHW